VLLIMKKDIRSVAGITALLVLLMGSLAVLANFIPAVVVLACAVVLSGAYSIAALLMSERREDRHNGYSFLLRMPVLPVELAAGKLMLMYLLNAFACGLVLVLVKAYGAGARTIQVFQSITFAAGCVWLISLMAIYAGICVLGFTKFLAAFRIATLVLLVAVQAAGVAAFRIGGDLPALLEKAGDRIAAAPWLPICIAVSAAYFACIASSGTLVRFQEARRDGTSC